MPGPKGSTRLLVYRLAGYFEVQAQELRYEIVTCAQLVIFIDGSCARRFDEDHWLVTHHGQHPHNPLCEAVLFKRCFDDLPWCD